MTMRYSCKAHTIKEQDFIMLKSCCQNIPARILSLQFYHLLYNSLSRIHSRKSSKSRTRVQGRSFNRYKLYL